MSEPAPDAATLALILRAAARAPDHGRLKPWRFIVIDGAAREALGNVLAAALREREPELPDAAVEKERAKPMRAPLVIVVAAHLRDNRKVPPIEQVIAAGAAAQNILIAAHALGFGAFWRTGTAAYDESVKAALGLAAGDAIVGFLYLGTTSVAAGPIPPSDHGAQVTRWHGPID